MKTRNRNPVPAGSIYKKPNGGTSVHNCVHHVEHDKDEDDYGLGGSVSRGLHL